MRGYEALAAIRDCVLTANRGRAPDCADQAPAAHTFRVCSDSMGISAGRSFPLRRLMVGRSQPSGILRPAYYSTQLYYWHVGQRRRRSIEIRARAQEGKPLEPEVVALAAHVVAIAGLCPNLDTEIGSITQTSSTFARSLTVPR